MSISKTPAYNLKAVLRETGLKADVLRAWERRYGIPAPERTQGGHRLYSEFDVALLKWLTARQGEGMSISRAVEMWKELNASGADPLAEAATARTATSFGQMQQAIYYPPENNLDAIRSHWLAACLNYNEAAAEQTLNQAFSMYPVETVCLEVLQRGMSEVGSLWYEGRASVQQEHFASSLAMRRLDSLLAATPIPTRPQTILVGCPPNEWHTFTPLLIALFLRRRGFNVIYLGANVPGERFDDTIAAIQPGLVILAAQQLTSAATLQQVSMLLSARGCPVAYGGRVFIFEPDIKNAIPANFLGDRLDLAVENIENLLNEKLAAPQPVLPSHQYVETLKAFALKRPLIEAAVKESLTPAAGQYMDIANRFMGDNILAALQLGEMRYIDSEIDWLRLMIKNNNLPPQAIHGYLATYASAVSGQMPVYGKTITDWINTQLV